MSITLLVSNKKFPSSINSQPELNSSDFIFTIRKKNHLAIFRAWATARQHLSLLKWKIPSDLHCFSSSYPFFLCFWSQNWKDASVLPYPPLQQNCSSDRRYIWWEMAKIVIKVHHRNRASNLGVTSMHGENKTKVYLYVSKTVCVFYFYFLYTPVWLTDHECKLIKYRFCW